MQNLGKFSEQFMGLFRLHRKEIVTLLLALFASVGLQAQLVETTDFDSTTVEGSQSFLDQASVGFDAASPNVTLKTYKLRALIGKGEWDLYLFNTVPAFSISSVDSIRAKSLGNDMLNQLGGLLNVSLSKVGHFGNPDLKTRDIKGGQIDFRIGGKVMDALNRDEMNQDFVIPVLQSTIDARYLIPLVDPSKSKQAKAESDIKKYLMGNLSFRVYGTIMQVLNKSVYNEYFTDTRGNPASTTLITGNVEVNLFISNQFYLSAGYSISNQNFSDLRGLIGNRTFFSISYTGQGE